MARLAGDAQFKGLHFKVLHEFRHAFGDGTKIVVVHLLILRTFMSHECSARQQKVGACRIKPFVNKEVFLFPSEVSRHAFHFRIK